MSKAAGKSKTGVRQEVHKAGEKLSAILFIALAHYLLEKIQVATR